MSRYSIFTGNEDEPPAALVMHGSCNNRGDRAAWESGVFSVKGEEEEGGEREFDEEKKKQVGWSLSLSLCMLTQLLM